MQGTTLFKVKWMLLAAGLLLPALACAGVGAAPTPIPASRPANFIVQTVTATPNPTELAQTPIPVEDEPAVFASLGSAPTHTPDPNATATPIPPPTSAPTPEASVVSTTVTAEITSTQTITVPKKAAATPTPAVSLDPPRSGGDWDFEADFVPWGNPYGEPCPGASVAGGWLAFVEKGQFGSSCLNENLYKPNVFSGLKSQEITFDFIAANSGVLRPVAVQAKHKYKIAAYAKHDHSLSVVQMFLGVDLSGGTDWTAATVQWFPWKADAEDTWNATEETITATGDKITIFIRGVHPMAEKGGKTVIDNVSITDLGTE